jgi:hypothetical protein
MNTPVALLVILFGPHASGLPLKELGVLPFCLTRPRSLKI